MSPHRKRKVRLVVSLSAAVLLASALIYTSFSAANPALSPSRLLATGQPGRAYQLTGVVVPGSIHRVGATLEFALSDRGTGSGAAAATAGAAAKSIPVSYTGVVPDPFRAGREVIVTVRKQGAGYAGERDSLITKCPSKYSVAPPAAKSGAASTAKSY